MAPQTFIRKPWIYNLLVSENEVNCTPKKAKARVTWINRKQNQDGTHNGQLTDCVHKINVVFSEKAVTECLKDKAHGHVFIKHLTDIVRAAVVLIDYQVVPRFACNEQIGDKNEFLLAISNFKVMPGFIGPLAYSEEIPENLKESKHEKAVKEKLRLLWVNQYGNQSTINASGQDSLLEMDIQDESEGNLSCFLEIADEVWKEKQKKDDLIHLYRNYELLEKTDSLEIQDVLNQIRVAHMKYVPYDSESSNNDSEMSQEFELLAEDINTIPTINSASATNLPAPTPDNAPIVNHTPTTNTIPVTNPESRANHSSTANLSLTTNITSTANEILEKTPSSEIQEVLNQIRVAHMKYAPYDSESSKSDSEMSQEFELLAADVNTTPTTNSARTANPASRTNHASTTNQHTSTANHAQTTNTTPATNLTSTINHAPTTNHTATDNNVSSANHTSTANFSLKTNSTSATKDTSTGNHSSESREDMMNLPVTNLFRSGQKDQTLDTEPQQRGKSLLDTCLNTIIQSRDGDDNTDMLEFTYSQTSSTNTASSRDVSPRFLNAFTGQIIDLTGSEKELSYSSYGTDSTTSSQCSRDTGSQLNIFQDNTENVPNPETSIGNGKSEVICSRDTTIVTSGCPEPKEPPSFITDVDRILNGTVSPNNCTPVPRPPMLLSQTSMKLQERPKRQSNLWSFIFDYWKGENNKMRKKN